MRRSLDDDEQAMNAIVKTKSRFNYGGIVLWEYETDSRMEIHLDGSDGCVGVFCAYPTDRRPSRQDAIDAVISAAKTQGII